MYIEINMYLFFFAQEPAFFLWSQGTNCHRQLSSWNKNLCFQCGDFSTRRRSGKLPMYWDIWGMDSYPFQNTVLGPLIWIYLEKILLIQQTPLSRDSKRC